ERRRAGCARADGSLGPLARRGDGRLAASPGANPRSPGWHAACLPAGEQPGGREAESAMWWFVTGFMLGWALRGWYQRGGADAAPGLGGLQARARDALAESPRIVEEAKR